MRALDYALREGWASLWRARGSSVPAIIAIAQTPDSWMWLASLNGIYRFDGIRFERYQPPGNTRVMNDIWS